MGHPNNMIFRVELIFSSYLFYTNLRNYFIFYYKQDNSDNATLPIKTGNLKSLNWYLNKNVTFL